MALFQDLRFSSLILPTRYSLITNREESKVLKDGRGKGEAGEGARRPSFGRFVRFLRCGPNARTQQSHAEIDDQKGWFTLL